jgi:hypothetical protein
MQKMRRDKSNKRTWRREEEIIGVKAFPTLTLSI